MSIGIYDAMMAMFVHQQSPFNKDAIHNENVR